MAVSGTITKGFRLHSHPGFAALPVLEGTVGGTALTVPAGYFLPVINSSGVLVVATADQTAEVVGLACESAAAGAQVRYVPAWVGIVWECTLEDQSNEAHALTAANKYAQFAMQVDPAGSLFHYADENDTTNTVLSVVNFVDAATTVRGRVLVSFMQNKTIWGA